MSKVTTVGFPTADFPAPLPFSIELPIGWLGAYVPGALVAAYKPVTTRFRPNVVVTWQRAALESSVRAVAGRALELALRGSPRLKSLTNELAGGNESFEAAYTVLSDHLDDDLTILHARLFVLGPRIGALRDLYEIVGTYPSGDEALEATMRTCLMSFALAIPAGGTA